MMLGFIYLMLILGWILIVLFLRCKKSIAPHFAFTDNYTENVAARQPTVHVIELPSEDFRDDMDSYSQVSRSRLDSYRSRSVIDERTIETYPTDAVINPAYTNDEEYILNAPPPTYDEVMRQPEIYPRVSEVNKSRSNI
ncbi:uncharacterized protein LOC129949269 isoform X1 [Eupeodes corollae]|uniref:uncharacterized protein LOC129949269 isoform X1 n=1 Tax=Eupeodes corollae TaxID=290404 RepID=UPI0024909485|nr:uncharacterized protein LOC129949269 isoform X1 [Eupeodes corollae]